MANSKKGTAQVNPPTPKQRVAAGFGSKGSLVDDIIRTAGLDDDVRSSLMQVSNSRLIKHHHAVKRMASQFGSKNGVIEAILATRYGKRQADEGVREKLESYSPWRLMDLHRQAVDIAAKQEKAAAVAAKAKAKKAATRAKIRARRAAR